MPSSQGYRKVASEPPIEAASGVGGDQDSPSTMATTTGPAAAPGTVAAPGTIQSNPAGKIPATNSQQRLMAQDSDSATSSLDDADIEESRPDDDATTVDTVTGTGRASAWFTVGVLCFVNLINYMDRFTIAGVLTEIQDHFQIGDDEGGLLQTAFVLSYMICAPIFGYLGDRYSRKWIMVLGVSLWSTTTLLGSYMNHFGWFITFRALVGIGEASYSTIAPTIISDLFVGDMRSKMLAMFYFAIPVGSGCGYIIGAEMASLMNSWVWALRVTPVLGAIAVALIIMLREPVRGQSEASHHMQATSYTKDIKALVRNRSFMLSTGGFTCVAFVAGALAWWGPKFIHLGLTSQAGNEHVTLNDVSYRFGIVAMTAGLIGVPLGSFLSRRCREFAEHCDPLICAAGLISSSPFIYLSLVMVKYSGGWCFTFVFFGELLLNLSWSIVADMLLYVVVPTRRSTAEAFQILISHALGDAGSPYFVGLMSEAIKRVIRLSSDAYSGIESMRPSISMRSLSQLAENVTATTLDTLSTTPALELSGVGPEDDTPLVKFRALQYSLFSTCFVEILGGLFFMVTAIYIVRDKARASAAVQSCQLELSESSGSASDGNATDDGLRQAIGGPLCTGAPCDGGVHEHRRPFAAS
ncbi:protein spinster isoform X2 [Anopheles cruzii]|uniref:protein spinster isoform X2 n=1 Tax=Anopheles cruzii TaxID=68878 RepID=UPI0022EC2D46|nr:protein spinster isoform X2 [Anopheles cruzii]